MSLRSALTAASLLLFVTGASASASASECGADVHGDGNNVQMSCTIIYQQRDGSAALIDGIVKLAEIQGSRGYGTRAYTDDFDHYAEGYVPVPRYVPDIYGVRVPNYGPRYRFAPGPRHVYGPGPYYGFRGPRF